MKKAQQIQKIIISGDHVSVYDTDGAEVKITRAQRQLFKNYKHWNFLDKIADEFSRDDVMAKNYCVIKDGDLVVKPDYDE